jgi:hypothetical protein
MSDLSNLREEAPETTNSAFDRGFTSGYNAGLDMGMANAYTVIDDIIKEHCSFWTENCETNAKLLDNIKQAIKQ